MNVTALIATFRAAAQDEVVPYLWPDAQVLGYLNDAVNEACERAGLIEDSTTPAVCSITLVPTQGVYALHEAIIRVKRLTFRGRALTETSVEQMDSDDALWETRQGESRKFILTSNHGLRLVPAPVAAEAIALTVYRTPITALALSPGTTSPEIPERMHLKLLDWMLSRAYLKADSETFDKGASDRYEAAFTQSFGARVDANVQRKRRDRRPHVVRFGW